MSSRYIPAIDGMRAIAISLVVGSHYGLDRILPGGFGVTFFFFISGFLITRLLLSERADTGTILISSFFIRRLLRLAPALIFMVVCVSIAFFFHKGFVPLTELSAALFYYMNYYLIFEGRLQMPLGALWSLAVEEHYYIVFPTAILLFWKYEKRLIAALGLICVFVLLWRVTLVTALHAPENRTYLATDTRIDSILFGAILAATLATDLSHGAIKLLQHPFSILCAVLILLTSFLFRDAMFRETARYTVQGIALAPLFYSSRHAPFLRYARQALEFPATVWIGKLSYGIYLWHSAVQFFATQLFPDAGTLCLGIIELCLSVALAAISYHFIESYFRRLRQQYRSRSKTLAPNI
jgi:peptidoglycan/LPS O-acetylase OafA/YrhL